LRRAFLETQMVRTALSIQGYTNIQAWPHTHRLLTARTVFRCHQTDVSGSCEAEEISLGVCLIRKTVREFDKYCIIWHFHPGIRSDQRVLNGLKVGMGLIWMNRSLMVRNVGFL